MSLLGSMVVIGKQHDGHLGFEYHFIDYIIGGYSGKDNVQVATTLSVIIERVRKLHPKTTNIVFQSDNDTCFASQDLIPYLHHINSQLKNDGSKLIISRWIYTEAQMGHGRLDTHFSYLNVKFSSCVEDGNDMTLEKDIYKDISFGGGIKCTTAVLLDVSNLTGPIIEPKFKCNRVSTCSTHDIIWCESTGSVSIYTSSDISTPEVINR